MALNPIESFPIDHPAPEVPQLQFQWGDLTQMGPADTVDVLVVSALPGDYAPTPGSLIGALAAAGISVEQLAQNKETDYRPQMPCWISKQFQPTSPGIQFNRVLVYEPDNPSQTAASGAWAIFQALRCFYGTGSVRVAMPLVSTGSGGAEPAAVLNALSWAAVHYASSNQASMPKITIAAFQQSTAQQLQPTFSGVKSGYGGVFGLSLPGAYASSVSWAQGQIGNVTLPANLTQRQAIAICIYTTNYYGEINGTLRGYQPSAPQYQAMFPLFEAIDSGLANVTAHNGTTYRRENMGSREGEYQPGKVITDIAYTSTSLADLWSGRDLLQIAGSTGGEIWSYSAFPSEQEVLFDRNFVFTVNTRNCNSEGCTFGVSENVPDWCGG